MKLPLQLLLFILLIGLLWGTGNTPASAQTKVLIKDAFFEIDAKKAIDSLYNRNVNAAQELLEPWKKKNPGHPIWLLWDGMELWWEVLEDLNDQSRHREFFTMMERADYEAGKVLRSEPGHPDALIIRSVANGYIARLHSNRQDWLTSVQVGRKAYQAHQQLMEVAPELPDNLFAEGMKMYYADHIPEAYPVVKSVSWFFPEGNKTKGLESLENAARRGVFAGPEANYFLANILMNYEQDYEKAKQKFKQLISKYPGNGYYRRQYLRTLSKLGQYHEILVFGGNTLNYWAERNLEVDPVLKTEIDFWMGRAHFYNRDWPSALTCLKRAEESGRKLVNSDERDVYVMTAYFTGRTLEIMDQKSEARAYYKIAADQKSVPEARKRSRNQLKNL